jgi:hypothetical protein
MTKTFKLYCDSGHSWLAVKRQLLEDLGLINSISEFSYVNGKTVYLEEDGDLVVFKNAYEQRFGTFNVKDIDHGDRSWVRNMTPFVHSQTERLKTHVNDGGALQVNGDVDQLV